MNHEFRPSTVAWGVLIGGIALYDVLSPQGETLSEGVDRALEHSPAGKWVTLGALAVTGAHLANLLPEKVDPFHLTLKAIKG